MTDSTNQIFAWIIAAAAISGCGSKQARNPSGTPSSSASALEKEPTAGTSSEPTSTCAQKSGSLGLTSIAGNELSVLVGGKRTSLCDVLEQSGKPVAIFQFAGILCLSCQEEAAFFEKALKDAGIAKKLAHIVVITDFPEDFSEADFADFMTKFAPSATRVQDDRAALWKHFSITPALPTRPTLFAMNQKMESFVINEEGADYKPMLEKALALGN